MDKLDHFAQDVSKWLRSEYPENYSFECIVNQKPDGNNILRNYDVTIVCKVDNKHIRTLYPNEMVSVYEHWLNEYNHLSGLRIPWQIELTNILEGK